MATKKKAPKTNADAVRDSNNRKKDAGLKHIKVWVHPEEVEAVRKYASRKPKTKETLERLKN